MAKFLKKKKAKILSTILFLFITVFPVISAPMTVRAAGGWWIDSENVGSEIYNTEADTVSLDEMDWSELEITKPNAFEAILGDIVYFIGKGIDSLLNLGGDLKLGIDNVVLGRMGPDSGNISFMQFGLETGNPWGILGARVFVAIRSVIYGAFLLYMQVSIILQMLKGGGGKARAETKELVENAVFAFILIYAFPYILQVVLYVRDVLMYLAINKIGGGTGVAGGLLTTFENLFLTHKSLLNALIYLATVFAGFWFLSNYVGNALIQTGLFGAAPFIILRSVKNKRLFQQWFNTITINTAVPLIDTVLILIPAVLGKILNDVAGIGEHNITFMVLRLFIIFSVIPARNGILRVISDTAGGGLMAPGGGMGALGALAMRAAMRGGRALAGGESIRDGIRNDSSLPEDDMREADMLQENSQRITEAEREIGRQTPDIDQLLAENGQMSPFEQMADTNEAMASLVSNYPMEETDSYSDDREGISQNATMQTDDYYRSSSGVEEYQSQGSGSASIASEGVSDVDSLLRGDSDGVTSVESLLEGSGGDFNAFNDVNDLREEAAAAATGVATASGVAMAAGNGSYGAEKPSYEQEQQTNPNALYGHTGSDELSRDVTNRDAAAAARYENLKNIEACQAYMDSNDREIQKLSLQESKIDTKLSEVKQGTIDRAGSQIGRLEESKAGFEKDKYQATLDYNDARRSEKAAQAALDKHNSGERVLSDEALRDVQKQKVESNRSMRDAQYRMEQADARMKDADVRISEVRRTEAGKAYDLSMQKANIQQQRQQLEARNANLKQAQTAYKNSERDYAALDKAKGGSGQEFKSSQAFKQTAESNARRAKLATVLNFDSSKFNGVLTPEERAERLRERAMNRQSEANKAIIRQNAKNAAIIAGSVLGATVGMYGGASNMVYTGMAAGMGVEKASNIYVNHFVDTAGPNHTVQKITPEKRLHMQQQPQKQTSYPNTRQNTRQEKDRDSLTKEMSYDQTEEAYAAREHVRNNMQQ